MQEVDSERRLQLLKGVKPEEIEPSRTSTYDTEVTGHRDRPQQREGSGHPRKRKRIAGEDETDREIRYAIEDAEDASTLTGVNRGRKNDRLNNAPIVDSTGHINLIPSDTPKGHEKNAEAEAEKARKRREYEDQYTMRFSNAAGQRQSLGSNPWYSTAENTAPPEEDGGLGAGKDVWGNEDPRRRQREKARIDSSDPLAAMKKGVTQLKDAEKKRREWNEERQREMEELKEVEPNARGKRRDHHRHHRHHRHRRRDEEEDLEGFSLDQASMERRHHRPSHTRDFRSHSDDVPHRHHHRSRHRSPSKIQA